MTPGTAAVPESRLRDRAADAPARTTDPDDDTRPAHERPRRGGMPGHPAIVRAVGRPTLPAPGSLAPELEARTCAAVEAVAS